MMEGATQTKQREKIMAQWLFLEKHLCDVDASQRFKQQFVLACSSHKMAHWPSLWGLLLYEKCLLVTLSHSVIKKKMKTACFCYILSYQFIRQSNAVQYNSPAIIPIILIQIYNKLK